MSEKKGNKAKSNIGLNTRWDIDMPNVGAGTTLRKPPADLKRKTTKDKK